MAHMLTRGKQMLRTSLLNQPVTKKRVSPDNDAKFWCESGLDKAGLKKSFVSDTVGYGIFATKSFQKGDFLLEYVGERVSVSEAEERYRKYQKKSNMFYIFHFKYAEKEHCVDATKTRGHLCQFVNDSPKECANSRMKLKSYNGYPRLCLFVIKDICVGDEITYDYGDNEEALVWRKKISRKDGAKDMMVKPSQITEDEEMPNPFESSDSDISEEELTVQQDRDTSSSPNSSMKTSQIPVPTQMSRLQCQADEYIQTVNMAASKIQHCYWLYITRRKAGEAAIKQLMEQKGKTKEDEREKERIEEEQQQERRKQVREKNAKAIQELLKKQEEKRAEVKRKPEEQLAMLQSEGKILRLPKKHQPSVPSGSSAKNHETLMTRSAGSIMDDAAMPTAAAGNDNDTNMFSTVQQDRDTSSSPNSSMKTSQIPVPTQMSRLQCQADEYIQTVNMAASKIQHCYWRYITRRKAGEAAIKQLMEQKGKTKEDEREKERIEEEQQQERRKQVREKNAKAIQELLKKQEEKRAEVKRKPEEQLAIMLQSEGKILRLPKKHQPSVPSGSSAKNHETLMTRSAGSIMDDAAMPTAAAGNDNDTNMFSTVQQDRDTSSSPNSSMKTSQIPVPTQMSRLQCQADEYIQTVNMAASKIQHCYWRYITRRKAGEAAIKQLMEQKGKTKEDEREKERIEEEQQQERRKQVREKNAKAIQELLKKQEEKRAEVKRKPEEQLAMLQSEGKILRLPKKHQPSVPSGSSAKNHETLMTRSAGSIMDDAAMPTAAAGNDNDTNMFSTVQQDRDTSSSPNSSMKTSQIPVPTQMSRLQCQADEYIQTVNMAASKIQHCYWRYITRRKAGEAAIKQLMEQKGKTKEDEREKERIEEEQQQERRKQVREKNAKAIQELLKKQEEKRAEVKRKPEEQLAMLQSEGKILRLPKKHQPSVPSGSSAKNHETLMTRSTGSIMDDAAMPTAAARNDNDTNMFSTVQQDRDTSSSPNSSMKTSQIPVPTQMSRLQCQADEYIQTVNMAASKIQHCYWRYITRRKAGEAAIKQLMEQKGKTKEDEREKERIEEEQQQERRKQVREKNAKAIQELLKKREEKRAEVKRKPEEQLAMLQSEGKILRLPKKHQSFVPSGSSAKNYETLMTRSAGSIMDDAAMPTAAAGNDNDTNMFSTVQQDRDTSSSPNSSMKTTQIPVPTQMSRLQCQADEYIQTVNMAASKIQHCYWRYITRRKAGEAAIKQLMEQKGKTKEDEREKERIEEEQQQERRKQVREKNAKAIQELLKKREEKRAEVKRKPEEQLAVLQSEGKFLRLPKKHQPSVPSGSSAKNYETLMTRSAGSIMDDAAMPTAAAGNDNDTNMFSTVQQDRDTSSSPNSSMKTTQIPVPTQMSRLQCQADEYIQTVNMAASKIQHCYWQYITRRKAGEAAIKQLMEQKGKTKEDEREKERIEEEQQQERRKQVREKNAKAIQELLKKREEKRAEVKRKPEEQLAVLQSEGTILRLPKKHQPSVPSGLSAKNYETLMTRSAGSIMDDAAMPTAAAGNDNDTNMFSTLESRQNPTAVENVIVVVYTSEPSDEDIENVTEEISNSTIPFDNSDEQSEEYSRMEKTDRNHDDDDDDDDDDDNDDGSVIIDIVGSSDKVFFEDYKNIYFRKTEKSDIGKFGQLKKLERVFKTKHACLCCGRLYTKIYDHIFKQHNDTEAIKNINEDLENIQKSDQTEHQQKAERLKILTILRNRGDHLHNLQVLKNQQGEVILARRPDHGPHILKSYKPCPSCFMWICNVEKHRSYSTRCVKHDTPMGKRRAELISRTYLSETSASTMLQDEVFSKMSRKDPVAAIAMTDRLIIELGNDCLKKNIRNPLRRGSYASSKMRLTARLLQALRTNNSKQLSDYIESSCYQTVMKSVCELCGKRNEAFSQPNNALKLGYYLKEVADIKYSLAVMDGEKTKAADAKLFRELIQLNWAKDVSCLATATIAESNFNRITELPLPKDLKCLSEYLQAEAKKIDVIACEAGYRNAVMIAEARLLTYNKRRPGELEALRHEQYRKRPPKEHHMEQFVNSLSQLEKILLDTHEIVTVRGKRGRPVPIILPPDIIPVLEALQSDEVRLMFGVHGSPYLFASLTSPKSAVIRASDSLEKVTDAANLDRPELIKSTILRKYIATTIQVLSLDEMQMNWVAEHLGHSLNVEKMYYRIMSTTLERAKIAKLLILADKGILDKFKGKKLDEISLDDISDDYIADDVADDEDVDVTDEKINMHQSQQKKSTVCRPKRKNDDSMQKKAKDNEQKKKKMLNESAESQEKSKENKPSETNDWTLERRAAYKEIFSPHVKQCMLSIENIRKLVQLHPALKSFTISKIKNKINADVQRNKRRLVKDIFM